jgi:hypothetical protein
MGADQSAQKHGHRRATLRKHSMLQKKASQGVNYPDLPRSGLLTPHLVRVGLPVSVSELACNVDTTAPDATGGVPSQAVRSVPLLPDGHSTTTDGVRLVSRLYRRCGAHRTTSYNCMGTKSMPCSGSETMTALYPLPTRSLHSLLEEEELTPAEQVNERGLL